MPTQLSAVEAMLTPDDTSAMEASSSEFRCVIRLIVVLLALTFSSCVNSNATGQIQQQDYSTSTVAPAATTAPGVIGTAIPLGGPTPIQPTPSIPSSTEKGFLLDDFLFSSSADSACQIPCWEGLVVGSSNVDDIQAVFDNVFGFNGTLDFFGDNPLDGLAHGARVLWHLDDVQGAIATGYVWEDLPQSSFAVFAWLYEDSSHLAGLHFDWSMKDPQVYTIRMSPQRVIRELGTPDYIFAAAEVVGPPNGMIHLLIIYEQGVVVELRRSEPLDMHFATPTKVDRAMARFCLGDYYPLLVSPRNNSSGDFYVFEPFSDGLNDLLPLQDIATTHRLESPVGYSPIDEVFGITIEKFVQLAQQEDNACLSTDVWQSF